MTSERRGWFDRLARMGPAPGFGPELLSPLREHAPGLWTLEFALVFGGGLPLPTRTTVVRRESGGCIVISPPPLGIAGIERELASLGPISDVIAPSSFHYLFATAFAERHPDARFWVAPGLRARVPDLPERARELVDRPAALADELDLIVFGPTRGVSEVAIFHTPTRTLVLTDLAFGPIRHASRARAFAWRLFGLPDAFGTSRSGRLAFLGDRETAQRALRAISAWPFERVLVAHGEPVEDDAHAAFERAFSSWL